MSLVDDVGDFFNAFRYLLTSSSPHVSKFDLFFPPFRYYFVWLGAYKRQRERERDIARHRQSWEEAHLCCGVQFMY
jgi:hypothetical protein